MAMALISGTLLTVCIYFAAFWPDILAMDVVVYPWPLRLEVPHFNQTLPECKARPSSYARHCPLPDQTGALVVSCPSLQKSVLFIDQWQRNILVNMSNIGQLKVCLALCSLCEEEAASRQSAPCVVNASDVALPIEHWRFAQVIFDGHCANGSGEGVEVRRYFADTNASRLTCLSDRDDDGKDNDRDDADNPLQFLITVLNSSDISFENIRFTATSSDSAFGLINISNSERVSLTKVRFQVATSVMAIAIKDSHAILIDNGSFTGAPYDEHSVTPMYERQLAAVDVVFSSPRPNDDVFRKQGSNGLSSSGAGNYSLLILDSVFEKLDTRDAPDYLLRGFNSKQQSATALAVNFAVNSRRNTVAVKKCRFERNIGSLYSTVFLRFGNDFERTGKSKCEANFASFEDSFFFNNHGSRGGALFVKFKGIAEKNFIRISECEFVNNSARQEGGAILLRLNSRKVGEARSSNSLLLQSCLFQGNKCGSMLGRPGAAFMALSLLATRLDSRNEQPKRFSGDCACKQADEWQIKIRNSTFRENAGLGTVFLRGTRAELHDT